MNKGQPPKTVAGATPLLERYAKLDARLAMIEHRRNVELAKANVTADNAAAPILAEMEALRARLEPWWKEAGPNLANGKKSLQLGGCMIGSRAGKAKLAHSFETDDKAVEAVRDTRWANQATKVKYSLDRTAIVKLLQLDGVAGKVIAALGFSIEQSETFYIDRVEQPCTLSA